MMLSKTQKLAMFMLHFIPRDFVCVEINKSKKIKGIISVLVSCIEYEVIISTCSCCWKLLYKYTVDIGFFKMTPHFVIVSLSQIFLHAKRMVGTKKYF